jgi:hypothetical protein
MELNFLATRECMSEKQFESVFCSGGRSAGLFLCSGQVFTKLKLNPFTSGLLISAGFIANESAQPFEMMADIEMITA